MSLVVVGVYFVASFLLGHSEQGNELIPFAAMLSACLTAICSVVSYFWAPQKFMRPIALLNYVLISVTLFLLIFLTGGIHSPYIILWVILSIFSGLFGPGGLGIVFILANAGIAQSIIGGRLALNISDTLAPFLLFDIPVAISYFIWRESGTQESKKEQTLDALTRQLSQVANKSEIVINSITEGVVAIDAQGTIQLLNPAAQKLLGWSSRDAIGLDYKSVIKLIGINGKELPELSSPIRQVLTTGDALVNNDLEIEVSGKKKLVSLVISPVGNKKSAIAGAIAVFRDITGEKMEERQKAEFISTASHEMRTPVAAIEGYLALALNPATAAIDDKAHSYLVKAQEATQHLGKLFQDLLTVSRAEDNRLAPKPSAIDIVSFVRELTDSLVTKAQDKGLFLYFNPDDSAKKIEEKAATRTITPVFYTYADDGHLREVVNNLIDNAIKYTKQGSVEVNVSGDDNAVYVSVTDTGLGIPAEDVPHLFQKFYRIDNSDTREIGGTGLGLYICRRLIEANGGRVWVTSTYGKGSTFYLQLPRISHEQAAEIAKNAQK